MPAATFASLAATPSRLFVLFEINHLFGFFGRRQVRELQIDCSIYSVSMFLRIPQRRLHLDEVDDVF